MRLLVVGNIPIDLVMQVAALPQPGADVPAERVVATAGGAFHVVRAASAAGLPCSYAGSHGAGPYGNLIRAALTDLGATTLQPPLEGSDTGLVVVLVDRSGERAFVTAPDAVVAYPQRFLDGLNPVSGELVYLSGYLLSLREASLPLARWVARLPGDIPVFCDLGPHGITAGIEVLAPVLRRVDWLSCNAREATLFTDQDSPAAAARALGRRTGHAAILVRSGADGCWMALPGEEPELVAAPAGGAEVDTTGAGDTHSGAFLAALAAGNDPRPAVTLANAAAGRFVRRETVRG